VIILCSCSLQSNAQLRGSTPKFNTHKLDAQTFIRKSNKQKTIAWILMGLSAGLVTTGLVISNNAIYSDSWGYDASGLTAIPIALGGCGMFGSLALFGASTKNRRHADILLKNENVGVLGFNQRLTAIGLKFSF